MMPPPGFAPFRGLTQVAYVTTDIDQTMADFGQHYGVPNWLPMRELTLQTDGETASGQAHVALAWVGATQLELIQPLSGAVDVYRWGLPGQGYGYRFHHLAQLMETAGEFEAALEIIRRDQLPVVLQGMSTGGLVRYVYTDHRETLGHLFEHIYYAPEARGLFDHIPRN